MDKERKIQIIKAAVKRFTKHGLNKTTLDEVARDLRIGKATIYHYFQSKEDLYYKTLLYEISLYIEEIKILFNDEAKTPQQIISEYLDLKETLGSRYRLIFELLLHVLTGTHIETETECLKELLKEESSTLNGLLKRAGKNETGNLPGFLAAQSWGFLFGGILRTAAVDEQENISPNGAGQPVKKENLFRELEIFFEGISENKK